MANDAKDSYNLFIYVQYVSYLYSRNQEPNLSRPTTFGLRTLFISVEKTLQKFARKSQESMKNPPDLSFVTKRKNSSALSDHDSYFKTVGTVCNVYALSIGNLSKLTTPYF